MRLYKVNVRVSLWVRHLPVPKVPRCGSLAPSGTNGPICQSGTASAQRGSFSTQPATKKCTVTCTFCRSAQHRPNGPFRSYMSATSAALGINFGQQGPNFGSNFGPWLEDGAIWPQLDPFGSNFTPSLGPHGLKMRHMAGPIRDRQNTGFHLYFQPSFGMDHALCWAMFPMLCLRQAQLGAKLSPKCSKLRHVGPGLDPVHHMAPPNFCPTWQIGANLGSSSWVQDGPRQRNLGASWAPVKPGLFMTRWKLASLPLCQAFFGFGRGFRARPYCPHCPHWACLGSNFGARWTPPHRTKLRMLSPTCIHTCPSCTILDVQLGSSWAQVGAVARVRRKLRPSWAQGGSCSAQVKAKDGQVWPQSAVVGPSRPTPFLSIQIIQFSGQGRFSSRSDSNILERQRGMSTACLHLFYSVGINT